MRREIRYGLSGLRRRPTAAVIGWSVPQTLPATISGIVVARAVDDGFGAGRPWTGAAWLAALLLAAVLGAVGGRMVFLRIGDLVEPFRDRLVRRVVGGSLSAAVAGEAKEGAVAQLTRQVEIVRDSYAGLIVAVRGFVVTSLGVTAGLMSLSPRLAMMILPPFFLGLLLFVATLGVSAARQRRAVRADERLADRAASVLAGTVDLSGCGGEVHGRSLVAGPIAEQARAERALAWVAALRSLCFVVGGWLPLIAVLAASGRLVEAGFSAGTITGGLLYILYGLQPALNSFISGVGGSGLRFVVTLGRILDSTGPPEPVRSAAAAPTAPPDLEARGLTFAYGPHSEPIVHNLDLRIPAGDHLAIVGASGIGKSTLAGLLCGLLPPDSGTVSVGGRDVAGLSPLELARFRVLIPQEAYVFAGTVRDNLAYLRPEAGPGQIASAVDAVGASDLVERIGGPAATVEPSELSAGERQQLALVRAHLSPAPICVLDEATCHLDPVAERRAEAAFAERPGTLIVIAHRTGSAERARRVLVLDGAAVGEREPAQIQPAS
ncbi:ATP-binding cassette domain-containing protein [Glycomyces xiaoerkulensis]|uniref:ATP-binding cassette domain-containing protein n=1 Tax=Glycomyces xiaoerkulensis TaxID=2038139 RepID=UPI000C25B316|nr:ABC transporter ATP-binding protein [Glycomyces xiaoerkulensis]